MPENYIRARLARRHDSERLVTVDFVFPIGAEWIIWVDSRRTSHQYSRRLRRNVEITEVEASYRGEPRMWVPDCLFDYEFE